MTTANDYDRLALFQFSDPGMEIDEEKSTILNRIVSFIFSAYTPMFPRIHLKPRAPDE